MEVYNKIMKAYELTFEHGQTLNNDSLFKLLQSSADSAACNINMMFLPLMSTCAGLMCVSTAVTHRRGVKLREPNILWTCVAADPGIYNIQLANELTFILTPNHRIINVEHFLISSLECSIQG